MVLLLIEKKYSFILDSFGIEYISQEVFKIKDKSIRHNIFRIQSDDSVRSGFLYITYVEYKLAEKALLDYISLFIPNDYPKNAKIIYKYLRQILEKKT